MRIAFLVHGFPPHEVGGVELYTKALVGALRQLGLDCVVLAGSRTQGTRANLSTSFEDGIPVTRLLNPRRQPVNRAMEGDPEADALIRVFLLQTRPDVVHVQHWVRLSPSLVAMSAELGIPAVVTLPDQWTACPRIHRVRPNLQACNALYSEHLCLDCVDRDPWQSDDEIAKALALRYRVISNELALAARLLVPTEGSAEFLSKISGLSRERLQVLPLGWPHETPIAPLPMSDSPQGPLRVGHWGNLHVLKGCHLLLLAAKLLPKTVPLRIHLWGHAEDPAYGEYLSTLAEGLDVTFHGRYNPKDLQQAELDLVVFPSLAHETYSFVLDEALALGLPVVVPDRGVLAERAGAKGVSFVYGSTVDLSRVLKEMALSPERLRALQRAPAPPPIGFEEHARCLVEVYRSVRKAKGVERVLHQVDSERMLFLQGQVDERERRLETLLQGEVELRKRAQLAETLAQRLAEGDQQVASLQEQVAGKEQAIQALRAEVAEAQARAEAEQGVRAGLEREREALAQRLAEGDQQVASLQEQVAGNERAIQALGAELAEAQARAGAEQGVRADLEGEREALAQRLAEGDQQVARLQEKVAKITSSTAWDLVQALSRTRVALAPLGSRRDRAWRLGIRGFRLWRREGGRVLWRKAFQKMRYRLVIPRQAEIVVTPPVSESGAAPASAPLHRRLFDAPALGLISHPNKWGTKPRVIACVPANSCDADLISCLESLRRQRDVSLKVMLVYSGTDGVPSEDVRSLVDDVRLVPADKFRHSSSRNLVLDHPARTTCSFFLFTVQDAFLLEETALAEACHALCAHKDQGLAALTARQLPRSDADLYAAWMLHHNGTALRLPVQGVLEIRRGQPTRFNSLLDNVCALIDADFFAQYRFNEALSYAEDLDLALRFLRAGMALGYSPRFCVAHSHTRAADYFLRRGYVDTVVRRGILREAPDQEWSVADVLGWVGSFSGRHGIPTNWLEPLGLRYVPNGTAMANVFDGQITRMLREIEIFSSNGSWAAEDLPSAERKALAWSVGCLVGLAQDCEDVSFLKMGV